MVERTNLTLTEKHVNCGTSKATLCSECGGESSCGGDCEWRFDLCQPLRAVRCGDHAADICALCPGKGGNGKCAGDCLPMDGQCEIRTDLDGMEWDEIAALATGIFFAIILVILVALSILTSKRIARQGKRERLLHQEMKEGAYMTSRNSSVLDAEATRASLKMAETVDLERQRVSSESPLAHEGDAEVARLDANPNLDDDPDRKSRVPLTAEIVKLGDRVVRGPDWEYQDQDGGKGKVGFVRAIPVDGWVLVKWKANGKVHAYKTGKDGTFHLSPAPQRPRKGDRRVKRRLHRKSISKPVEEQFEIKVSPPA